MNQQPSNGRESGQSAEHAEMLSELSRIQLASAALTRLELRGSVVDTFTLRWGMSKDEVAKIFDEEFPASASLAPPGGAVTQQDGHSRKLLITQDPTAGDYAFEVRYQTANGRTQTIVQYVDVAGSQGATVAKSVVAARQEVRRILGCKSIQHVGIASEQRKLSQNASHCSPRDVETMAADAAIRAIVPAWGGRLEERHPFAPLESLLLKARDGIRTTLQRAHAAIGEAVATTKALNGNAGTMVNIAATIEGDNFRETINFTSTDVVDYHMPGAAHGWDELSEQDQTSFAEDYALWTYARRYGNHADLRVEVTFELAGTVPEILWSGEMNQQVTRPGLQSAAASDFETLFVRERARADEERSRAERLDEWAGDAQKTIDNLRQALEVIATGDPAQARATAQNALDASGSGLWMKEERKQQEQQPSTPSFGM